MNRQLRLTSADMAGGRAEVGGQEQSIRALAASASLETLAATSIVLPGGRKVRLDELATLEDAIEEPRTFARFNGEPVVAFSVSRGSGASDAEVAAGVEKKIAEFGAKARDGKLCIEEMTGGTFSISNGGVFGSMMSTPIINPPQSAILGMHAIKERAIVENGQVVAAPMMYIALSYDHRIIDGKDAVLFLVDIKNQLENPHRMLLGM